MPLEPFLKMPGSVAQLLSRRGVLHAGLLPLLALRGAAGEHTPASRAPSAAALPPEGINPSRRGLAISSDGSTAYVAFTSADVVLVVDLQAGRVRAAIDLSTAAPMGRSTQAVLSADGRLLFVASNITENLVVIDTAQECVRKVLPLTATYGDCLKASPKGTMYAALSGGRLAIVSCDDLSYRTLSVSGVAFYSVALSPQHAYILYNVGSQAGDTIFHAVNLETGTDERRAVLPKETYFPGAGVARLLLAPSGDVAYLGFYTYISEVGFGNLTAFDLTAFRVIASTPIEDGVNDFVVHPETGKVYAVGVFEGSEQGRVPRRMYIVEWDPASRAVTRRLPIFPSLVAHSIQLDPANRRFVYSTENNLNFMRKIDIVTGAEVMRVRFFRGKRFPGPASTSGALAYIACEQSPLIHQLDLDSGRLVGSLTLPARSGTSGCEYFDGKLYLTGTRTVYVISATDGSLILSRQLPDGLRLWPKVAFFRDKLAGAAGLAPNGDADRILVLDARTLEVVDSFKLELKILGLPGCVVASPDGSKLYVQQGASERNILEVLDSATLRVRKRIEPPRGNFQGGAGDVADFDEGKRIAYLGGFSSIYKVHMDSDEFLGMLNIYDVYQEMGRPRGWSASGLSGVHLSAAKDRLLIMSSDAHSVFQYDLRNERWIPRVVDVGLATGGTAISPDRRYLYVVSPMSDAIVRLDTASGDLLDVIPVGGSWAPLNTTSLRHGASFEPAPAVPGAIMAIVEALGAYPGEIGPPLLTSLRLDSSGRVATELADTRVYFDGIPAPILYAYASQVGVVVPYGVAGKNKVKVQLVYKGEETSPQEFSVADALPGIFTMDSSGQGQAAMLSEDGTLNGSANPAAKGSVVVFYATGGGQTDPPGVDGQIVTDALPRPRLPVGVWVQGREAQVLYAGGARGMVSGVMQVNIKLPMDIPSDNKATLTMKVGNSPPSQEGVTMAVR